MLLNLSERAAEANDNAFNAAIAHEKVRGDANHRDRNIRGRSRQEILKVLQVSGLEQNFRRAADAEPCFLRQRRIFAQAAADFRKAREKTHAATVVRLVISCCGSAWAQLVIEPAPMQRMRS